MRTFIIRGSVQEVKGQGKTRDVSILQDINYNASVVFYYMSYNC